MPSSIIFMVSTHSFAPSAESLSNRLPPVSSGASLTVLFAIISPVSTPSSILMVVTPVNSSPLITAHWIGAAPLYFGRSEACTLIQPYRGISRILFDRICPKATTIIISALNFLRYSILAVSLILTGWNTSIPCESAHSLTGVYCIVLPRPFGLSGCVTTSATSCPASIIASSVPTEKSGVPMKITLILLPPRYFPSSDNKCHPNDYSCVSSYVTS